MMRSLVFSLFLFQTLITALLAQESQEIKCFLECSKMEVLANNKLQVSYVLENVQNARFEEPEWPENVQVVYGPSQSSQVQVINGVVSSKISWTYVIKPTKSGKLSLPDATFAAGDKKWTTDTKVIEVKPNPDGIEEEEERPTRQAYDFWGNPIPQKPAKKPEPKRPTIRI